MTWTVVEGVYKDGQVRLNEDLNHGRMMNVLVLVPVWTQPDTDKNSSWNKILQKIVADKPELLTRPLEEQRRDFDRLSEKIAEQMPYQSVQEFEQAMRGDHYDLVRY